MAALIKQGPPKYQNKKVFKFDKWRTDPKAEVLVNLKVIDGKMYKYELDKFSDKLLNRIILLNKCVWIQKLMYQQIFVFLYPYIDFGKDFELIYY